MPETRATLDVRPTFCVNISDNSYAHLGLFAGDEVMCDEEAAPARVVIGVWDNKAHICTDIGGKLFDEAKRGFAPESAKLWGRVLYVSRRIVPV